MDNDTQTSEASPNPVSPVPEYRPPGEPEPVSSQTNKMAMIGLVAGAAVVGAALWWWMSSSDKPWAEPYPTPTPETQNQELNELNQLDADPDLNSEFQQIDQDLNNL